MPELPEVETTRRGIAPHAKGHRVTRLVVRDRRLRWPVPDGLERRLAGHTIQSVKRRAKYLLFEFDSGTLILHLGMSGSLFLVAAGAPPGPHDHLDLVLDNGRSLRLRDPRRFGAVLWTKADPLAHPRLRELGPEPLDTDAFNGDYLYERARGRRQAVKNFVMDGRVVVGVGNIYASEALFAAGIRPSTPAGRISRPRYARLAKAVRQVLTEAIAAGGTTLRDFVNGNGRPGYFSQYLRVYGRAGQPCPSCGTPIRQTRLGQRSTFHCPRCQR